MPKIDDIEVYSINVTFKILQKQLAIHLPIGHIDDILQKFPRGFGLREPKGLGHDAVGQDEDDENADEKGQVVQLWKK